MKSLCEAPGCSLRSEDERAAGGLLRAGGLALKGAVGQLGSHVWLAGVTSGGGRGWTGRVGANHRAASGSPVRLGVKAVGNGEQRCCFKRLPFMFSKNFQMMQGRAFEDR